MLPIARAKPSTLSLAPHPRPLRVGFLSLTDAAPLIAAHELGIFAKHGVAVELKREVGWATIREKIIYGELDAAQAPAPMLWATQLGIGSAPCDVLTALILNLHGNALTLSHSFRPKDVQTAAALQAVLRSRSGEQRFTFGVVFPFSSHHLLLRQWLITMGVDPDHDVRIVIVPPAQMFRNLVAGTIDGYCAGEPWNSLAIREGAGWSPAWSAAHAPGHIEKVLMVTRRFAAKRAKEHGALVAALVEACAWCDEPQHRERLAAMLADARYLNLPTRVLTPALLGRFDCGHGRIALAPDFVIFHRGNANVPTCDKAVALQHDLTGSGLLVRPDPELPRQLFREDLYRDALSQHHTHELESSPDLRGVAL